MGEGNAWVTLATNDSYCLGALVLAHSLRRAGTVHPMAILVTPGVTPIMKERLSQVFSQVVSVDVLDSGDAAHLALLARPELGITFTKLHCWSLTQYSKCVFLDADTLVLQNCDELFEKEELSAAPDVGWPDCFNSGVFVYRPSNETFQSLVSFAKEKGSFDGGDQGLLNQYFSNWSTGDISKHLSFLYNVCSTSFYSYLPALKQYGKDMKIVHFIGNIKPWLQKFNWGSRSVMESGTLQGPLQLWWDIFIDQVHPVLDVAMPSCKGTGMCCEGSCSPLGGRQCGADSPALYSPPDPSHSVFPWHRPPTPPPSTPQHCDHTHFVDPWDHFTPAPYQNVDTHSIDNQTQAWNNQQIQVYNNEQTLSHNDEQTQVYNDEQTQSYNDEQTQDRQSETCNAEVYDKVQEYIQAHLPRAWYERCSPEEETRSEAPSSVRLEWNDTVSLADTVECGAGGSQCGTILTERTEGNYSRQSPDSWHDCTHDDITNEETDETQVTPWRSEMAPPHPYDNYYLLHRVIVDSSGCKRCSHETPPPPPPSLPTDITVPPSTPEEETQAGLAGALSQMSIGSEESIPALDEHLRRQGWEAGNIDYLGADKFDNIWAKISQTLSVASPPEPALPPQTTPTPTSSPAPEEQTEEAACTLPCVQQAGVVCTRPCAQLTDAPVCTRPCAQVAEAPVCTRPCAQVAEAPVCSRPASEKSDTQRSSVSTTDSWENVESCTMTPAESVASSLSLVAKAPGESSESSIESSTDSSFSSVPSMAPTDEKDSQAMTEKKKDNKRAEVETKREPASVPPPKPMEKLVCHLKPAAEVDPLLTPDSEQEDAATLAQSIIASEEALISSPVITSATPTVSSPVCSAVPQNIKDLSVETNLPGTPPASGPVSLAQIGILPSLEITAKETKASEIKEKVEAPKEPTTPEQVKPKTQVKSRKIVEQVPKTPETVEPKAPVKSPKEPKTPEKVEPKITKKVEPKTPETVEPKTPETVEPKKSGVELIKDPVKKVKKIKPKTTEAESDKNTLVCSLKTQDTPQKTIAEVVLPTDLENIKLPKNLDKALIKTDSVEEKKTVPSKVAEVTPKLDVAAKIEEPSSIATESEEVTVKPKVKKVVKKVPAAPKTKTEAEGAQGAELPVPPPRKKVVKPKEK